MSMKYQTQYMQCVVDVCYPAEIVFSTDCIVVRNAKKENNIAGSVSRINETQILQTRYSNVCKLN